MVWVRYAAIYGTDFNALRRFGVTDTLGAFIGDDVIDCLPLNNCLVPAFRFAGPTANTLVSNLVRHPMYLLILMLRGFPPE
jgi:hypothetical protein